MKTKCFTKEVKNNLSETFEILSAMPKILLSLFVLTIPLIVGISLTFFISDPLTNVILLITSLLIMTGWVFIIGIPFIKCYIIDLPG